MQRLRDHYGNDVWTKRRSPPKDWNKPLPEYLLKEYENTYLNLKAKEMKGEPVDNVLLNEEWKLCSVIKCPQPLLAPLIKIIIQEVRSTCKKEPTLCGFNPLDKAYEPLRFMQSVIGKTNEVCRRYLDNSKLCSLPAPGPPYNVVSACAIKNSRRRMEDRHVIVHDLSTLFSNKEVSPSSYYAIFDGHAGHDAAAYSCAHLHQFLGENKQFCTNPKLALREAFLKTDTLFNDKCKVENFRSGTTAICALLKHKEKTLYIAWVGDSQAVLVGQGHSLQCVQPHKPCREDEKQRIEELGGTIIFWGSWRVNGQLAVSRAIGDLEYKPYVTAVPDIREIPLNGSEDFLILACDGLWDVISEKEAAQCVYEELAHNQDDIESVSERLVQLAKQQGSCDNISVIVVFLREPSKVAAEAHWATRHSLIMDTLDNANATNPFANSNNPDILGQKEGFVLNLADGCKQNGTENVADFLERSANGKRSADEFDDDEDLGPETDVDCIDELSFSPTPLQSKGLVDEIVNNNPFQTDCDNKEEKATLEMDSQKYCELREETPTPPADSVQDTSGLVDNVAESGEESEDEWNYFKGDQAEKENINPSESDKKISDLDLESDTMSQLNPNAAEFVPVSPKRDVTSPVYQALMDDMVIAQSPKRFTNNDIDIKVPNPQEFETEIKQRPGDVVETEPDNAHNLSSQEIMENLLNGKTMEEIEFQPSLPKANEFHFGPNSTPFSTPGKFMDQSTKAVIDDESNYLNESLNDDLQNLNKEENCMSISFYQEEDEPNALDLNKVQVLPENLEEFLERPKSDDRLTKEPIEVEVNISERLSPFKDHLSVSSGNLGSQSSIPDLQSPVPDVHDEVLIADVEPPKPNIHSPLIPDEQPHAKSPISEEGRVKSPISEKDRIKSPISEEDRFETKSPMFDRESPVSVDELKCSENHEPEVLLPEVPALDLPKQASHVESPVQDLKHEFISHIPIEPSPLSSPVEESTPLVLDEPPHDFLSSPIQEERTLITNEIADIPIESHIEKPTLFDNLAKSPLSSPIQETRPFLVDTSIRSTISSPVQETKPFLEIEPSNSVKLSNDLIKTDTIFEPPVQSYQPPMDLPLTPTKAPSPQVQSPLLLPTRSTDSPQLDSPVDDITSSVKDSPLPLASPTEILETIPHISDSPKSIADTESIATTDVNSFIERSRIPDIASPLSGDETQNVTLEIKSEIIAPEFPVQTVTTPSQESKSDDVLVAPAALIERVVEKAKPATAVAAAASKKTPARISATKLAPKAAPAAKAQPAKTTAPTKPAPPKTASAVSKTLGGKLTPKDVKPPSKVAEKKPIANGDVKPLAKKPALTATKTTPTAKAAPLKLSPTKVTATKLTPTSTRPLAAKPAPKPAPPKPSPTTVKNVFERLSQTKPSTVAATKSTTSTLTAKPKTTVPPMKPRTLVSKLSTNAPDTEKQIKESTNKQLTASRLSSPGKPLTSATRKPATKPAAPSKTSVDAKKPAELVRHSTTKPKTTTTTGIKKPPTTKTVTNGVTTKVSTTITRTTETKLIKDVSPIVERQIVDNSQILEMQHTD
ncbi:uncharacterized protein LOC116175807 isoform X3 [Photinus pyralis]|nr:uncharacterized protein LOC116175807 isoform X3 [Photinus pyralis]